MSDKKLTQAQNAYNYVKNKIMLREFCPGTPILEMDIAKELGMSRTPVHEAIRKLESEGYLDILERKGAFVKYFSFPEVIKCYEVMEGLEGMVGYLVAELNQQGKISRHMLHQLDKLVTIMDDRVVQSDASDWLDADIKFHQMLHKLCGNRFLVEFIDRLQNQFNMVSMYITPLYIDKAVANEEHKELLQSIKEGDSESARKAAQFQRRRIRNQLMDIMGDTF